MNTKVRIGPIEKRVRELWEEDLACTVDDFLRAQLDGEFLDKYVEATEKAIDDDIDHPWREFKSWKAIDIRFAKMADKRKGKK